MKANIQVKSREYATDSMLTRAIEEAFQAGAEWMRKEMFVWNSFPKDERVIRTIFDHAPTVLKDTRLDEDFFVAQGSWERVDEILVNGSGMYKWRYADKFD